MFGLIGQRTLLAQGVILRTVASAFLAMLATAILGEAQAQAQNQQKALAERLYGEGRTFIEASRWAEACEKLQESEDINRSAGTELNLGLCLEKLGKTASSWVTYKDAGTSFHARGDKDREDYAKKSAARLEPTLSTLRILSTDARPGLQITLDGVAIGRGSLNSSDLPLNPGEHTVEAKLTGAVPYKTNVTLGPNADKKTITIPELASRAERSGAPRPRSRARILAGVFWMGCSAHRRRRRLWRGARRLGGGRSLRRQLSEQEQRCEGGMPAGHSDAL